MGRNWLQSFSGVLALLFVCVGSAAASETSQPVVKTSKKSKKKAEPEAAQAPVAVAQPASIGATMQPTRLPPGERQMNVSSVEAKLDAGQSLKTPDDKSLLTQGSIQKVDGGKTEAAQTVAEGAPKRRTQALNLGTFRNQELTEGYIAPPGVADFAAYFRASNPALKASAPAATGAATAFEASRPGSMSDEEFKRQTVAETLRVQTVESIRQILGTKPPADQRIDLLIRQAEIQIERHAYALEVEIKTFNEAHDKWVADQKGAEPVFKTGKSDAQLLAGIEALRTVVSDFPNHARTPEALFNLGFLLTQIQSESSVLYFERLVARFPKSEYVPDAWLALGEFHFSKLRFDKALTAYQKLLGHKGTRAYNYAVYKIGWTWFNIRPEDPAELKKNLTKSLAAFKLVVKLADGNPADRTLKDLRRDSLRDMVLVFADLGDVAGAQTYFESLQEPELYLTMLERLAWQYSEAGEYAQSIAIYQRLIAEGAMHERLPVFYSKVPELYAKLRQSPQLIESLSSMASALSAQSPWMKKFAAKKSVVENRDSLLSKELKGWAEKFHIEAQKTKNEKRYDDALAAYTLYLDHFGDEAESYSAHFFKGELFLRRGKFLEASDEYMKAASLDEKHGIKGKYTNQALVNAIGSVDKVLEKSQPPQLPEAGKAAEKIPLTSLHERLVKGIDAFVRLFPQDPLVLELSHRAARVTYMFGDYGNARLRWMNLARLHPRSQEVYDGLRLVLKVFVERKDWDNAIADSRSFLGIQGVREAPLGKDVTSVLKAAMFSKAIALEQADKRAEAADLFSAYHKEFQEDAEAPKALFNAANNRFKIGRIDDAISTLKIILAQYPKSSLVQNAHYMIASSYDALGRFADSAASYEQLAKDSPKNSAAPDALLRAGEERLATGEAETALRDAMDFLALFPGHAQIGSAHWIAGQAHLKMGNQAEAVRSFLSGADLSIATNPQQSMYLYGMAADTALKSGDKTRAQQVCLMGKSLWERFTEKGRTGVALEGIRLVGSVEVALLDERLPPLFAKSVSDGLQVVQQFSKIRDEAAQISQKYAAVVKLGNAEAGVASLYRIAEIQEFLANTLLKTPIPAGASPEEVEQFKGNIEKIAIPLQEEAGKLYLTAWQKGNETEAMTPFMKKIHDKLVVQRPSEFRGAVGELPAPAYYSSDLILTEETQRLIKN